MKHSSECLLLQLVSRSALYCERFRAGQVSFESCTVFFRERTLTKT